MRNIVYGIIYLISFSILLNLLTLAGINIATIFNGTDITMIGLVVAILFFVALLSYIDMLNNSIKIFIQ